MDKPLDCIGIDPAKQQIGKSDFVAVMTSPLQSPSVLTQQITEAYGRIATLEGLCRELCEALDIVSPFGMVQGDAMVRVSPESKQRLNTSAAWLVSQDVKSGHKARSAADRLNEALTRAKQMLGDL